MPSVEDETLLALVQRVLKLTQEGKLHWREMTGRGFAYEVDLPSVNIDIVTLDEDGAAPYELRVWERVPSGGLSQLTSANSKADRDWGLYLNPLYQLVRRQVTGVDRKLHGVLQELDQLD